MSTVLSILAALLAVAWLPIVRKFYKAWTARRNPVSLAICWLVLVVSYSHLLYVLVESFGADHAWVSAISVGFSFIACINFYVSFYWSEHKFQDQRRDASSTTPPKP